MEKSGFNGPLEKIDDCIYRIPKSYKHGMRVEGRIFATSNLIKAIRSDQAPEQVANVAFLPGIQGASLAMPDIHWGYGFPIGGVCATDPAHGGVVSPGGVGYDINCGVRLLRTNLTLADVGPRIVPLVEELFRQVPTGVGRGGEFRFGHKELKHLMTAGPGALIKDGLATNDDIDHTEGRGRIENADPSLLSDTALDRGRNQCGTLGSGKHFIEIDVVDQIVDEEAARVLGLTEGQVTVLIHSGSRGLGYQVCDDALRALRRVPQKYGITLPDHQLACAPINSDEGRTYLKAMGAAANFAWCNRQLLMMLVRESFQKVFGKSWSSLGLELIYDVAHNIAKFERHIIDGVEKTRLVHRKGATRAFPPGHPDVPPAYRGIGQPVIIPGDMGRASWVLVGQPKSMELTFGSSCHGAGRTMSRKQAVRVAKGRRIDKELLERGVVARACSLRGLAEEQPDAYKNVDEVVEVVHRAGLSKKVARLRPIGVIKG